MSKKILIVDDEPDFLENLSVRLSANGYEVAVAHHGEAALEKIGLFKPDLILSDIVMPRMDGVDFFDALRRNPQTSQIPIVIMTVKQQLEGTFRKLGVYDFIVKPIGMEEFVSRIQACLQN